MNARHWQLLTSATFAILLLVASGCWGLAEHPGRSHGCPSDCLVAASGTGQSPRVVVLWALAQHSARVASADATAEVEAQVKSLLALARRGQALIRQIESRFLQRQAELISQSEAFKGQRKSAEEVVRRQQLEGELTTLRENANRLMLELNKIMGHAQTALAQDVPSWPRSAPLSVSPLAVSKPPPSPSEARGAAPFPSPPAVRQTDMTAGQHDVQHMMTSAMTRGGMDNEKEILTAKRRIEARAPSRLADSGARRQARTANEQGRSTLRESRAADAVQAFQVAYKADPTDVEIINNFGSATQGMLRT